MKFVVMSDIHYISRRMMLEGTPAHIRLQPENPRMRPFYARSVTILGKVTAVYRVYNGKNGKS